MTFPLLRGKIVVENILKGGIVIKEAVSFLTYGRQTMGPDWYIAPISGVCRVYVLHSGHVLYKSETEERTLTPDTLYLFPQNLTFQLITDTDTRVDHTYFDFFATPAIFSQSAIALPLEKNSLLFSAFDVLEKLINAYPFENTKTNSSEHALITSYFTNLLTLIHSEAQLYTTVDPFVAEAINYIHNHYASAISVNDLATEAHMDTSVFIRKFKRFTNTTPYQYIKNYRINLALSLIKTRRHTLSEIAEFCGYADASALSHAIRSVTKEKLL